MSDDRTRATGKAIANRTSARVEGLLVVAQRRANDDEDGVARLLCTGTTSRRDESSPGGRRSTNPGLRERGQVGGRDERGLRHRTRRLDDPAGRRQHLGEGLVRVDQAPAAAAAPRGIGLHRVGRDHLGARLEARVDRRPQVVAQVDVDERGDAGQDDGHPGREGERQANPKRDARSRPGH